MFAVAVVIGLIIAFLGFKLFKPICFIVGALLSIFIILLIFYSSFLKSTTENWVVWTVLGCALVIGLLVGYIFQKIAILGSAALGFLGGYTLGLLLWNTFLYTFTTSDALFYTFTIGLGVIVGIIGLVFFDHIVILGSSMLGAYMVLAGVGIVAGGYTNPFTINEVIESGEKIDSTFYYYMAATVVLFVIATIVQFYFRHKAQKYQHPYHNLR